MMRATRNRGFIMAAAVGMIALVGVAAAATATYFAYEARRTRDADIAAQQRQLIMAGMVMTQQYLASADRPEAGERIFAVPLEIHDASLDLTWKASDAQTVQATLVVMLHGQRVGQSMTWQRESAGWKLTGTKSERLMDERRAIDHLERSELPAAVNLASP